MSRNDSGTQPRRRRLDAAAKAAVVEGLAGGTRVVDLARACGVTTQAFYNARRRDPLFDAGWRAAHAASAEAERRAAREAGDRPVAPAEVRRAAPSTAFGGYEQVRMSPGHSQPCRGHGVPAHPCPGEDQTAGEERIVSNNRRVLQRRRMRHVRFDAERRAVFLGQFRWSCDLGAAAAEAGVSERTVFSHLRADPEFAAEFQAALEQGYELLEAEAVRQRLAAQEQLRAPVEGAGPGGDAARAPEDPGAEFDRIMKLLARWDRRSGASPGPRRWRPSEERAWTFEEAIAALDSKLRALGVRRGVPPPAANDDGEASAAGGAGGGDLSECPLRRVPVSAAARRLQE